MYHYSSLESACAWMKCIYVFIARIWIWLKFKCPHLYLIACCLLASSTVEIKRSVWRTKLNFSFGCTGTLLWVAFILTQHPPPQNVGSRCLRSRLQWGQLLMCLKGKYTVVHCMGLANYTVLPAFENLARHPLWFVCKVLMVPKAVLLHPLAGCELVQSQTCSK